MVDFQEGFIYPYFKLMPLVLADLEPLACNEAETATCPTIHYFDPALDTWVKMKLDSIIELMRPS